jgi:hypothetical protein
VTTAETSLQPYEDIMPEPCSLKTAILDILETPRLLSEVIDELHKYKIYVVNKQSGFMRGYLDALADVGQIYHVGTTSNRKIYSRYPGVEFTHRRCPYCMRQLVIFESDVGGRYTCPKCLEESDVEMSIGSGIQMKKVKNATEQ